MSPFWRLLSESESERQAVTDLMSFSPDKRFTIRVLNCNKNEKCAIAETPRPWRLLRRCGRGMLAASVAMASLLRLGLDSCMVGSLREVHCVSLGRFRFGMAVAAIQWIADLLFDAARQEDNVSDTNYSPLISSWYHGNNCGLLVQSGRISESTLMRSNILRNEVHFFVIATQGDDEQQTEFFTLNLQDSAVFIAVFGC